jgi:Protein of unknown function (DUF4231)
MSETGFIVEFLGFLDDAIRRTKRQADHAMVQFVVLRLALVAASASLPALTTLQSRGWSTADAVLVAILAGLDTQFRWGEEWRHFRSTQLALERMRRDYQRRKSALSDGRSMGGIATEAENFDKLFADVEDLLQTEADSFFKFRITDWKSHDRPS